MNTLFLQIFKVVKNVKKQRISKYFKKSIINYNWKKDNSAYVYSY